MEDSDSEDGDEITLATPTKPRSTITKPRAQTNGTPKTRSNGLPTRTADRSAKRKSAQKLLQVQDPSDDEDELGEDTLARRILQDDEDNEEDEGEEEELSDDAPDAEQADNDSQQQTPSKRPRGRPKSTTAKIKHKQRTPTPPRNLPPHEHYFFQNRPGGLKTSSNTLSSTALLTHEAYFNALKDHVDPHQPEIDFLHDMHAQQYAQWLFELENGFSVGLFGWGSKKDVVRGFAEYIVGEAESDMDVVLVNGYAEGISIRDILATLASTIPELREDSATAPKLPANPADALSTILDALSSSTSAIPTTTPQKPTHLLLINSLDNPSLRRAPVPHLLSQLASHPRIALLATFDIPNFPLLWDASTRSSYNFAFHDATTFSPFSAEIPDVVDVVNGLLGRSGRRVQGREGVVYVLRSLTGSARRLFALILAEGLGAADEEAVSAPANGQHDFDDDRDEQDDDEEDEQDTSARRQAPSKKKKNTTGLLGGIEYRALYRKAVQSLIATSEVQFRQLLKEFFDHEMLVSQRGADGTEMLGLPFRREECEAILEELVVDEE